MHPFPSLSALPVHIHVSIRPTDSMHRKYAEVGIELGADGLQRYSHEQATGSTDVNQRQAVRTAVGAGFDFLLPFRRTRKGVVLMEGERALPLAIALVRSHKSMSAQEWRGARAAVAVRIMHEGYALLDIFDVVGDATLDDSVYDAVEALAKWAEASAVVVSGSVDRRRVDGIAAGLGMVVLSVPYSVDMSARLGVENGNRQEEGHA